MSMRLLATVIALVALAQPAAAASGSLDPDFGSGGIVVTEGFGQSSANAVAIQPADGKIVIAGNAGDDTALLRYSSGGVLEQPFGGEDSGISIANFGFASNGQAMSILSNGGLLVVGGANKFAFAAFDAAGELAGQITVNGGQTWWAYGLAMKPDGGFIASGEGANGSPAPCALVSATSAGKADNSFGGGTGIVISDIGSCKGVVRLDDGRLVTTADEDTAGHGGFGIARFKANGELDTGFGTGGVSQAFPDSFASVRNIVRQPDGKYLAVGRAGSGLAATPKSLVVARFNEDGTLDDGFAAQGIAAIGIPNTPIALVGAALVLDPAGNIVVGGTVSGPGNVKDGAGPSAFILLRLLPNGLPDLSFGEDSAGGVVTGFGPGSEAELQALALQSDGKVVAAGSACTQSLCKFALARYVLGPPVPVATTTTLPGGGGGGGGGNTGCESRAGFDGLACLCATPIPTAACGGQTLSKSIGNTFRKACNAVGKASSATKEKILKKWLKRTGTFFKQADTHTRRQARKKKRGLTAECAASLEAVFTSGRSLAAATAP
jgi:uncharacterized delta-60 repeat protein